MFEIVIFLTFLGAGYFVGGAREKKHFQSLLNREKALLHISVQSGKKLSPAYQNSQFVSGSVVIASDYFKNFAASLKNFFGGNVSSLETLMDRARREAVIRLKTKAALWGADEVLGLRIEFCTLDQMGVEVLAYGTAVKRPKLSHREIT